MLTPSQVGAIKTPTKSRYVDLLPQKARTAPAQEEDEEEAEDASDNEELEGSGDESGGESDAEDSNGESEAEDAMSVDDGAEAAEILEKAVSRGVSQDEARKRKRKQRDDDENLEANYFERLANEDEPTGKRRKGDAAEKGAASAAPKKDGDKNPAENEDADESADDVPVHESLAVDPAVSELEKANRTVFLSNVTVEAITSGKAKKTLLNHLASVLDPKADPPQKVQSIRFRSTAFETAGIPKRAAFIKKSVLEATTRSTNAYAVYSTPAAARLAVKQLNGTVVLNRHLRVDSVAHPAPVDHRRCVFVGNLGFVDDETVYNTKVNDEGKEVTEKRKRTKAPMDVEEGLWQVFNKEAGKVESVRVVRDAATRVGKGFAYVQFYVSIIPRSLPQRTPNPLANPPPPSRTAIPSSPPSSSTARNTRPCSRASCASAAARPRTRPPARWRPAWARPRPRPRTAGAAATSGDPAPGSQTWDATSPSPPPSPRRSPVARASSSGASARRSSPASRRGAARRTRSGGSAGSASRTGPPARAMPPRARRAGSRGPSSSSLRGGGRARGMASPRISSSRAARARRRTRGTRSGRARLGNERGGWRAG